VVQLVWTLYIIRVVKSSSPDWSENFLISHITYDSCYRVMAKWFGAHCNQEVCFSSAVKCEKGPQVLTSLLNQRRNYYYYNIFTTLVHRFISPSISGIFVSDGFVGKPSAKRKKDGIDKSGDLSSGALSDGGHSSDTGDAERKKKKARTTFTGRQIFELEKQFEHKKYLSSSERSEMAKLLQVTETQVSFVSAF